ATQPRAHHRRPGTAVRRDHQRRPRRPARRRRRAFRRMHPAGPRALAGHPHRGPRARLPGPARARARDPRGGAAGRHEPQPRDGAAALSAGPARLRLRAFAPAAAGVQAARARRIHQVGPDGRTRRDRRGDPRGHGRPARARRRHADHRPVSRALGRPPAGAALRPSRHLRNVRREGPGDGLRACGRRRPGALLLSRRRAGARRGARHRPLMARPRCGAPALGALALLCLPPAFAQHAQLEEVRVVGHYDNSVGSSDAASQGVVGAALLENRPALRTGEILEYVPGMIVTQHSGDGKANQYFLRGFNLDHGTDFATSVDGMPVNLPTHGHGHGYTDLNFLMPELVERIAYRKGPYFADNGDFSTAGSADILLRDRLERPLASIGIGEHGHGRLFAAGSTTTGHGNWLAAFEHHVRDGPWVEPADLRRNNALLRYSERRGADRLALTAMLYDSRWRATDQVPQRAIDAGLIDRFGSLDPTDGGRSRRASLSANLLRPLADGSFEARAWALAYRMNLLSNFTYLLEDPVNGDQFEQTDWRRA